MKKITIIRRITYTFDDAEQAREYMKLTLPVGTWYHNVKVEHEHGPTWPTDGSKSALMDSERPHRAGMPTAGAPVQSMIDTSDGPKDVSVIGQVDPPQPQSDDAPYVPTLNEEPPSEANRPRRRR